MVSLGASNRIQKKTSSNKRTNTSTGRRGSPLPLFFLPYPHFCFFTSSVSIFLQMCTPNFPIFPIHSFVFQYFGSLRLSETISFSGGGGGGHIKKNPPFPQPTPSHTKKSPCSSLIEKGNGLRGDSTLTLELEQSLEHYNDAFLLGK